jgi:hypothetical protein
MFGGFRRACRLIGMEGRRPVEQLAPIHFAKMLTYLKLSGCQVGLLINFNETVLTKGVRRVVRGYRSPTRSV